MHDIVSVPHIKVSFNVLEPQGLVLTALHCALALTIDNTSNATAIPLIIIFIIVLWLTVVTLFCFLSFANVLRKPPAKSAMKSAGCAQTT